MEREERHLTAKPKPSKQTGSSRKVKSPYKSRKLKEESSAAALPQSWLNSTQYHHNDQINYTQDGVYLPNSQPYYQPQVLQSNLDTMIQFKGSEKEGTSYRNYIHYPSTSSASNGDEDSDESYDTNQDLSTLKKQRLNQTNTNDYSMVKDSVADRLGTSLNLGMIYSTGAVSTTIKISDDSELRKQRRRQVNRESARKLRFHKQPECENLAERIETLKADNTELIEELKSLSEECSRIVEENKRIEKELIEMYGQDVINALKDSWSKLRNHEYEE